MTRRLIREPAYRAARVLIAPTAPAAVTLTMPGSCHLESSAYLPRAFGSDVTVRIA
jgi:hypothetical protein